MITQNQLHGGTVVNSASQFNYPAGPCTVALSNSGTQTAFVGWGTVSATNGFPLPSGAVPPFSFPVYNGDPGGVISVIVPSGTVTVGWLITRPAGNFPTGTLG